jgi:hypothetical protein
MTRHTRVLIARMGVVAWAAVASTVAAVGSVQVPIAEEPRHRPVFENAVVRVLDVNVLAGDVTLDHLHDHDVVTVSISGSETRTKAVDKPWGDIRPIRPPGGASVTDYADRPEAHRVENVGTGLFRLIAVENLRRRGWSSGPAVTAPVTGPATAPATPPATPPATTPSTESRAFQAYDVRLSGAVDRTHHRHSAPVLAVLVRGAVSTGALSAEGASTGGVATAVAGGRDGSQTIAGGTDAKGRTFVTPGQVFFVPAGEPHLLTREGVADAYVVEVELR